jgi:acetyltransferase-like isoleucine patch superfamily enzyme
MERGELTLGDDVVVGEYNNVRPFESFIRIGSNVLMGQFVSLIATNHAIDDQGLPLPHTTDQRGGYHGIEIGPECWIGAQAVGLPGVTLGARCVVGAGAVVTRGSYPDRSRLFGVPARPFRSRTTSSTDQSTTSPSLSSDP